VVPRAQAPRHPLRSQLSCSDHAFLDNQGRRRRRNGAHSLKVVDEIQHFAHLGKRSYHNKWMIHDIARTPDAVTHPGFKYKLSTRWIPEILEKPKKYDIPYVMHFGRISNSIQYRWVCKPSQLVTTLCATVYDRLRTTLWRRHKKKSFGYINLLLKVAVHYVFTRNDYFLNRVLALTRFVPNRVRRRRLRNVLLKYDSKLDDNTRFVIRQVCSQADWLESRSEKVRRTFPPRAKSNESVWNDSGDCADTAGLIGPNACIKADILRRVARCATVFWMTTKIFFSRDSSDSAKGMAAFTRTSASGEAKIPREFELEYDYDDLIGNL
jgi:hypothetical protein